MVHSDAQSVGTGSVVEANTVKTGTFVLFGRRRGTMGGPHAKIGTVCFANIVLERDTVSVMPAEVLSLGQAIALGKYYIL